MSISTIALCNRIGRRARGGDFTKLSMNEQADLLEAANAALQRLYEALPTYFKEQTQGFVLPAPATISAGVVQYSKVVTGVTFTDAQFGQTVVLDGDAGWNQIIGPAELLNPYMGTTGTVAGTVYGNAVYSTTYPLDRVIGDVKFADQSIAPMFRNQNIMSPGPWAANWLFGWGTGRPQTWWPQVFGNSQGNEPIMVLRFAPAPVRAYAINVRLSFSPKRLTLADYDANTALPVPDKFIEPALIPMSLQAFMSSPAWQTRGDEAAIELRGDKGELFAKNQPGMIATPSNRVYCPPGF